MNRRRYPHWLRVTRPAVAAGTQDGATGAFVAGGAPVVVYDGPADVQEDPRAEGRDEAGRLTPAWDARPFLPDERDVLALQPDDTAVATVPAPGGTTQARDATVVAVSEIDGSLALRWL